MVVRSLLAISMLAACGGTDAPDAVPDPVDGAHGPATTRVAFAEVDGPHVSVLTLDGFQVAGQHQLRLEGRVHDAEAYGDQVLATLRDGGALVKLAVQGDDLVEVGRVRVGRSPHHVVVDGDLAWVAVRDEDRVVGVDLTDMTVIDSISVTGGPTWLSIHDGVLSVSPARARVVTRVDLDTGEILDTLRVPELVRDGIEQDVRITGDATPMDHSTLGELLLVPVVYADTSLSLQMVAPDVPDHLPPPYYVSDEFVPMETFESLGRTVPVVVAYEADTGKMVDRVVVSAIHTEADGSMRRRSSPVSDLLVSGDRVTAFMENADAAAGIPWTGGGEGQLRIINQGLVSLPPGPREVVRTPVADVVHSFVAGTATVVGHSVWDGVRFQTHTRIGRTVGLVREEGDAKAEHGRRLFYSAVDPRVTTPLSGVSCSTCHVNGGADGFTWDVDAGPRQTPSLVGPTSSTAPMTWTDGVSSLQHEIRLTSQGRMASPESADDDVAALAAFVDTIPLTPRLEPLAASTRDAVARGEQLFMGSAGCGACHAGGSGTDRQSHAMYGLTAVDTPALRDLVASAPYLHDGRAASLAEVVDSAEANGMGHTEHLTAGERADLVQYLRSL